MTKSPMVLLKAQKKSERCSHGPVGRPQKMRRCETPATGRWLQREKFNNRATCRNRTSNPLIKSQLLCQLS